MRICFSFQDNLLLLLCILNQMPSKQTIFQTKVWDEIIPNGLPWLMTIKGGAPETTQWRAGSLHNRCIQTICFFRLCFVVQWVRNHPPSHQIRADSILEVLLLEVQTLVYLCPRFPLHQSKRFQEGIKWIVISIHLIVWSPSGHL